MGSCQYGNRHHLSGKSPHQYLQIQRPFDLGLLLERLLSFAISRSCMGPRELYPRWLSFWAQSLGRYSLDFSLSTKQNHPPASKDLQRPDTELQGTALPLFRCWYRSSGSLPISRTCFKLHPTLPEMWKGWSFELGWCQWCYSFCSICKLRSLQRVGQWSKVSTRSLYPSLQLWLLDLCHWASFVHRLGSGLAELKWDLFWSNLQLETCTTVQYSHIPNFLFSSYDLVWHFVLVGSLLCNSRASSLYLGS